MGKLSGKAQERCIAVVLLLGLIAILAPLFAIAKYNVPAVDDFAFASMAGYSHGEEFGILETLLLEVKQSYLQWRSWQGLYFSNFISFKSSIFDNTNLDAFQILLI